MAVTRQFGVALVRWELPFAVKFPPGVLPCWEEVAGLAGVQFRPAVGDIEWTRRSRLVEASQMFERLAPAEPPGAVPDRSYKVGAVMPDGKEHVALEIVGGPDGGFRETHPYTVAEVFLVLEKETDFVISALSKRAEAVLNNVLGIHWFMSPAGSTRFVTVDLDSFYTSASLARVPSDWPTADALGVLQRLRELHFSSEFGTRRQHKIGIGGTTHLDTRFFEATQEASWRHLIQRRVTLELYQELLLSAVRRLTRHELPFCVVDAQSAVEACVAVFLRRSLIGRGRTEEEVDQQLVAPFGLLQQRIVQLDKLAAAGGRTIRIGNTPIEKEWRKKLYDIRTRVVHHGARELTLGQAQDATVAGFAFVAQIEAMFPDLAPDLQWSAPSVEQVREVGTSGTTLAERFLR